MTPTDLEDALTTIYRCQPDIRFRRVGDEAVVLAQDQGEILVLNDVGARVLELIDGQTSAVDWLERLLQEYDVAAETLRADVAGYLRDLRQQGVIAPLSPPAESPEESPPESLQEGAAEDR